jgi:uncharacterized protein (TIRG00374 family)
MKFGAAFVSFVLITIGYIGSLLYFDLNNHIFDTTLDIIAVVSVISLVSLIAFTLRYLRWTWLLRCRGFHTPYLTGYLAYVAGFALTALPGKLGELVRVRYFVALNVPPKEVVACFFFERLLDLITVLILASLIGFAAPGFWVACAFVTAMVLAVIALCRLSKIWIRMACSLRRLRWRRLAQLVWVIGQGLSAATSHFNITEVFVSFILGFLAFGIQATSFVYIARQLGFSPGFEIAVAIFPLATLIGAASMIPGGIGTTEAATVAIMRQFGSPLEIAAVVAIAMRLGTLWFAIVLGICAAVILEFLPKSVAPKKVRLSN